MANYSLVINSKFQPFSFERYIQPYQMYGEAYKEVENALGELATKASVWEKLANEQTDKEAYDMYKSYADDLNAQADLLAKEGLNATSRRGMLNMRTRYGNEIVPLETAYNKRAKIAEEQRKARVSNPSIMYDRDFSTVSLMDIIRNPELSYTPISGNELYAKGAAAAKASSLRNISFGQSKVLGDQYWELTKRQGYSASQAAKFLADNNNIPELKDAIERIKAESGTDILSGIDKERAENYIIDGIMSGLTYGETRDFKTARDFEEPTSGGRGKGTSNQGGTSTPVKAGAGRISSGVEGQVSPDVLRVEGLRDTGSGAYSTTRLDRLNVPYQAAKKAFEEEGKLLEAEYNRYQEDLAAWEKEVEKNPKLRVPRAADTLGQPKPVKSGNVQRYEELKERMNKAEEALRKELSEVRKIESKYNHLGTTPYERILRGIELEKAQQKQQNNAVVLDIEPTQYDKARKGIANIYDNFTSKQVEGNVGLYELEDGKEKALSKTEGDSVLRNEDNPIALRINMGKSPKLVFVGGEDEDDKEYILKGSQKIDIINKNLKEVNDFLSDFTNIHKNEKQPISVKDRDFKVFKVGDYYGYVEYDPVKSTYTKYLGTLDENNTFIPLTVNTLEDEIAGAEVRDDALLQIAEMGLESLTYNK